MMFSSYHSFSASPTLNRTTGIPISVAAAATAPRHAVGRPGSATG